MTDTPLITSEPPQFQRDYWTKVPRRRAKVKIAKLNHLPNGRTEILLSNGLGFQRQRSEIQQLLLPGSEVEIEFIGNGELITGLFTGVGWAFRMTSEDLAEYTRNLAEAEAQRRADIRQRMVVHTAEALLGALDYLGVDLGKLEDEKPRVGLFLADIAIQALEQGPSENEAAKAPE